MEHNTFKLRAYLFDSALSAEERMAAGVITATRPFGFTVEDIPSIQMVLNHYDEYIETSQQILKHLLEWQLTHEEGELYHPMEEFGKLAEAVEEAGGCLEVLPALLNPILQEDWNVDDICSCFPMRATMPPGCGHTLSMEETVSVLGGLAEKGYIDNEQWEKRSEEPEKIIPWDPSPLSVLCRSVMKKFDVPHVLSTMKKLSESHVPSLPDLVAAMFAFNPSLAEDSERVAGVYIAAIGIMEQMEAYAEERIQFVLAGRAVVFSDVLEKVGLDPKMPPFEVAAVAVTDKRLLYIWAPPYAQALTSGQNYEGEIIPVKCVKHLRIDSTPYRGGMSGPQATWDGKVSIPMEKFTMFQFLLNCKLEEPTVLPTTHPVLITPRMSQTNLADIIMSSPVLTELLSREEL